MGTDNAVLAPPTFARADPAYAPGRRDHERDSLASLLRRGPAIDLSRSITGLRRRSSANGVRACAWLPAAIRRH